MIIIIEYDNINKLPGGMMKRIRKRVITFKAFTLAEMTVKPSERSRDLTFPLEGGRCRRRMRVHAEVEQTSTLTLPSPLKGEGQKRLKFDTPILQSAFTLAEMMVVMLLLSIVLAAGAPLMTKRSESTSLWRQTPNNANKIYYSTNDKQQALIGTKNDNVTNSKLHINSSNPSSYPHLTFGVNGAYAGVINVESTSRMSVKLAESTGNTFALDNSNLYVNGNVDIGKSGTNYTLKLNGEPFVQTTGVPIGTIIIWYSSSNPSSATNGKWLRCDGGAIDSKYTELRGIVGTNTPNFQGLFLRGYGTQYIENQWRGIWGDYWSANYWTAMGIGAKPGDRSRHITGGGGFCTDARSRPSEYSWGNTTLYVKSTNARTSTWIEAGGSMLYQYWHVLDNAQQIPTLSYDSFPAHCVVDYYIKASHKNE